MRKRVLDINLCEVCGVDRKAEPGACTNERCRSCHVKWCGLGGSAGPGHGRGRVSTPFRGAIDAAKARRRGSAKVALTVTQLCTACLEREALTSPRPGESGGTHLCRLCKDRRGS